MKKTGLIAVATCLLAAAAYATGPVKSRAKPPASTPPPAPSNAVPAVTEAKAAAPAPAAEPAPANASDVLGVSGDAPQDTEWTTLAFWSARAFGMGTIEVPVMNRRKVEEKTDDAVVAEAPCRTSYKPVRILQPGDAKYYFRARGVAGQLPPDIVAWPKRNNQWTLTVRVRPKGRATLCGLELQVGFPGASQLPLLGKEGETPAAPAAGKPPAKGAESATGIDLAPPPPAAEEKTVVVSAKSTDWTRSRMTVKNGDEVFISASGTWICGSKGEETDAGGYPNTARFSHYYLGAMEAPRTVLGASYGALLIRIGEEGKPLAAGKELKLRADSDGELFFDINERADGAARRDNVGTLKVFIRKTPRE